MAIVRRFERTPARREVNVYAAGGYYQPSGSTQTLASAGLAGNSTVLARKAI